MAPAGKLVVVFGGGVIGLHAAVEALEAGYKVKLIAKHLPNEIDPYYPSPMAAATWAVDEDEANEETRDWYELSYKAWGDLAAKKGERNKTGITWLEYHRYWESPPPGLVEKAAGAFWFRPFVADFEIIPKEKLPSGVNYGTSYSSFSVVAPVYLDNLMNRIKSLGGQVIRATLPTQGGLPGVVKAAKELLGNPDVYAFVNATGLGAQEVAGDKTLSAKQSHAFHIKGESTMSVDRTDEIGIYYAIPRLGAGITVIGGYEQPGNWSDKPDPANGKLLLERCKRLIPECLNKDGEFDVITEMVGLRPHRRDGPRSEIEMVKGANGKADAVIHCYGHEIGRAHV